MSVIGRLKLISLPLQALIIGFCFTSGDALAQTLSIPPKLINFNSSKGEELLLESKAKADYWSLSIHFVTQKNQAYCGVASSVIVLNSLGIPAPVTFEFIPYRLFTQNNFFSQQTRQVIDPIVVSFIGMTLDQLSQLLETYPVTTRVYHADESSLEQFRTLVVNNLQEPGNFVLVNYLRQAIGQKTGGHISPLAAYNESTDSFLILDVSRYKYPPVWVKAVDLWQAMATKDAISGKSRGFVLVSASNSSKSHQSSTRLSSGWSLWWMLLCWWLSLRGSRLVIVAQTNIRR